MTLQELCEPLFLYICRMNRSARKGAAVSYRQARGEIEGLFSDMRSRAASEAGLSYEFEKVQMPLVFFVDSMIAESNLPFAQEWHENRLAYEHNELAGDEKFFDVLEESSRRRRFVMDSAPLPCSPFCACSISRLKMSR